MESPEAIALRRVLTTGETPCPMREGIIAIENCLAIQTLRERRCRELQCPWLAHRPTFEDEIKQAKAANSRASPRRKAKAVKPKPKKTPGRKPWRAKPAK